MPRTRRHNRAPLATSGSSAVRDGAPSHWEAPGRRWQVIASRNHPGLRAERDVFYVGHDAWDLHSGFHSKKGLDVKFGVVNTALEIFVSEMRAQGV